MWFKNENLTKMAQGLTAIKNERKVEGIRPEDYGIKDVLTFPDIAWKSDTIKPIQSNMGAELWKIWEE